MTLYITLLLLYPVSALLLCTPASSCPPTCVARGWAEAASCTTMEHGTRRPHFYVKLSLVFLMFTYVQTAYEEEKKTLSFKEK